MVHSLQSPLTNRNESVLSHWELLDNPFRRNARFLEVAKHLPGCRFFRAVRRSDLDSMVNGVVSTDSTNICCDLAVFNLLLIRRGLEALRCTHLKDSNRYTNTLVIP